LSSLRKQASRALTRSVRLGHQLIPPLVGFFKIMLATRSFGPQLVPLCAKPSSAISKRHAMLRIAPSGNTTADPATGPLDRRFDSGVQNHARHN
jgi:hypothetical protein